MVLQLDEDEGLFPKHRGKELDVRETPITQYTTAVFGNVLTGTVTLDETDSWTVLSDLSTGFTLSETAKVTILANIQCREAQDDVTKIGTEVRIKIDATEKANTERNKQRDLKTAIANEEVRGATGNNNWYIGETMHSEELVAGSYTAKVEAKATVQGGGAADDKNEVIDGSCIVIISK